MAAVVKDSAIKLFGRTISLIETHVSMENQCSMMTKEDCRNESCRTLDEAASFEACKSEQPRISMTQTVSSQANLESKTSCEDSDGTEELKQSKRPDKIIPCPRCNSSDTKFCYFNNYNVNQPRHYCKSCQRYWTAGGTVRNVPIGAGRRRNKHLASQFHQIVASSDGEGITMVETPDTTNQLLSSEDTSCSYTTSSPDEMVLKFGPESPNCNSVPKVTGQTVKNGFSEVDLRCCEVYDKGSLPSGSPFSVPLPVTGAILDSSFSSSLTVPRCTTPNVSFQFVPAPYWNCFPIWVAGTGNISSLYSTGNGLQFLGKHSRDTAEVEIASEGISLPKARKIRDLDEV